MKLQPQNLTYNNRYWERGVQGKIFKYYGQNNYSLDVIDIGCSTGEAAKEMQRRLKEQGIIITTIGVDNHQAVRSKARENLDCFEPHDFMSREMNKYLNMADVVVFLNVANWVNKIRFRERRKKGREMAERCAGFLKRRGILITDCNDAKHLDGLRKIKPSTNLQILKGLWECSTAYEKTRNMI